MSAMADRLPEWAFYYPNPVWSKSNWLKNLILFFDGMPRTDESCMARLPR